MLLTNEAETASLIMFTSFNLTKMKCEHWLDLLDF